TRPPAPDTRHSTPLCDRSKPQRIQRADRPGAHREDVPDDAADARGRALEWLDRAGVVMGLDLKGNGQSMANINNSCVLLARADEDFSGSGRERFKQWPAIFVGAVL